MKVSITLVVVVVFEAQMFCFDRSVPKDVNVRTTDVKQQFSFRMGDDHDRACHQGQDHLHHQTWQIKRYYNLSLVIWKN